MGVSKKVSKEIVKEKRNAKTHKVSQKQHATNVLIILKKCNEWL